MRERHRVLGEHWTSKEKTPATANGRRVRFCRQVSAQRREETGENIAHDSDFLLGTFIYFLLFTMKMNYNWNKINLFFFLNQDSLQKPQALPVASEFIKTNRFLILITRT